MRRRLPNLDFEQAANKKTPAAYLSTRARVLSIIIKNDSKNCIILTFNVADCLRNGLACCAALMVPLTHADSNALKSRSSPTTWCMNCKTSTNPLKDVCPDHVLRKCLTYFLMSSALTGNGSRLASPWAHLTFFQDLREASR